MHNAVNISKHCESLAESLFYLKDHTHGVMILFDFFPVLNNNLTRVSKAIINTFIALLLMHRNILSMFMSMKPFLHIVLKFIWRIHIYIF